MKKQMFAWALGVGFSASVLAAETASGLGTDVQAGAAEVVTAQTGVTNRFASADAGALASFRTVETPPDKPGEGGGGGETGGGTPPDKPGEGGGGGETGGGSADSVILTGAYPYTGGTNTLAGQTLASTTSDQNVILAMTNAYVTVSNCVLNKSGDMSSEDNSNFYAVNAVVAAKTASKVFIRDSTLNSRAEGANCLFASGSGSTIYAYNCTLVSSKDSSRGLDATYEGTVIASKMSISTTNAHCAALATDRGKGNISATDSRLDTAGEGSPLIYSTGVIEANGVTGTATGAQIAGIEGLSTIRIKNSNLTGSGLHASEPIANGVLIYQSNSGDSSDGTATFEVSDSTFHSEIDEGAMFFITHSAAVITVRNTEFDFDDDRNCLLKAAGNDGEHGWGTVGSNGADVVFTAIDQKLSGNVSVDGISSLEMYLTNSTYTGTFINDTTYTGSGDGIDLFISGDSTWTVTSNCTLKSLTVAPGARIVDGNENLVSIVKGSEAKVSGSSAFTITVSDYVSGTFATTNITSFELDRTAFEKMYGTSESESGSGSGSSSGTGGQTYYFKPHAPTNGVVGVSYNGTKIYPDMDHKYWLDAYWTNGVTVTIDFSSDTTSGYFFADGSSVTSLVLTITENRIDVYPPAGFETAYLAQAKSGATYYPTLKEAIDAAKNRTRIILNDSVTLAETLTVTNSITLDLNAKAVTLGSALTEGFRLAANATISNGTIVSSLAANVEDAALLRFADGKATLSNVTVTGDGCLLCVDDGAKVTLTNNCVFTCNGAASVYCSSNGTLAIAAGTYKSDGVVIEAPAGYCWENGFLVSGTLSETVAAGTASEAYVDAQTATNAAAVINANKANCIVTPTGVEGTAKTTYLTRVAATVTGDNRVVVDLTPEAKTEEQAAVDEAVVSEGVVAALTSAEASATATLAKTTPGLYYWIEGGTDVGAVTEPGAGVLSKDGGAVELSKPSLDAARGRAFFRIAAGVAAPDPANDD